MFASSSLSCSDCAMRPECGFRTLPDAILDRMAAEKRTLTYARGETLYHMGDVAEHFYCVTEGRIQLFRSSAYREQSFSLAADGAWVGYRDALSGGDYQHSARTLTKTTVCKIPRQVLLDYIDEHPEFARSVLEDLSRGWVESENLTYNLGARKIVERMADFLLSLRDSHRARRVQPLLARASGDDAGYGSAESEVEEVEFPFTRETVATLMGTTTESVIRTLSDFKSRGWISMRKGTFSILDDAALKRLVTES